MLKKKSVRARRGSWIGKFEALEDRRLLTVFNVTTTVDRLDTANVTLAHPKAADGTLSLREAIYLANLHSGVADTVVLKKGVYKITIAGGGEDNNETGDFDVLDDLTIKSAGSGFPTISGNGLDRVFNIPSGFDGVDLTLNHVIVTGGIAHGNGGGVAGESDNNTLTILNSTIKNNISTSPGGFQGGGIYNLSGDINVTNSHVDSNSAAAGVKGNGGGIFLSNGSGNITIRNSTVNSNSAYVYGGGIGSDEIGALTIINSQINNNHAGDSGGGGAAVAVTSTTITNSTFSGNTTSGVGGGYFEDNGTPITITNSTFSNNSAARDGGAVWTSTGSMTISGSTFKDNTATGSGGAIGEVAALQVTGSTFNHNVAGTFGGAIAQGEEGDITILRSTLTQNASMTSEGGAIYAFGANDEEIRVTDSKFTFNSANTDGGAIFANGNPTIALRSTFDHNSAVTGFGGAIETGPVDATDSSFTYNSSKANGGGFNTEGNDITLLRCVIRCNTVTNGTGGGFTDDEEPGSGNNLTTITNCTIDGNTAGGNGGGFSVAGKTLTMSGSTVSNNRSGSDGGGAYVATKGLSTSGEGSLIVNCTFSGNGAADAGGGIDFEGDGNLHIHFATIVFNASFNGGGIAQTDGNGLISIANTIVAKNIATNGPDIYDTQSSFDDFGHNLFFSLLGQGTAGIPSGSPINSNDDIIGLDPKLGALANNGGPTKTHALLNGSPAINAGDDSINPGFDQRGVKRPQGPHVDIGAYEKK